MLNVKLTILNSMSVLQTNNLCLRNISILKTEGVGEGRSKDRELGGGGSGREGSGGGHRHHWSEQTVLLKPCSCPYHNIVHGHAIFEKDIIGSPDRIVHYFLTMYFVQLVYFAFTRMPGKIYRKWLRSFLCLYDVFRALINSLVCRILDCLHATHLQNMNASGWPKLSLTLLGINYISRTNYLSRNMFRLFSLINTKVYQADPGAPSPWQKKESIVFNKRLV